MEIRFRIIQLMFMRLVLVYLQAITVLLFSVNNVDRKIIKDMEDETVMLKVDISRLAEELDEST